MASSTFLELSVPSVAKYISEIWTWVVEHLSPPGGRQEYAKMRVKNVSQVHVFRNKLGNMYAVAVSYAGLYISHYFYKILNKTVMNQQSFIVLTSNKFSCKPIQPFLVEISDRRTDSQPDRQTEQLYQVLFRNANIYTNCWNTSSTWGWTYRNRRDGKRMGTSRQLNMAWRYKPAQ